MKKMNNKGFMLTETLIVSTLIITVLLVVYIQFKSINRRINNSYDYDPVISLYNLYNVKLYIEQENFSTIIGRLDLEDYVDITSCSDTYFTNSNYCKDIINNAGITKLLATRENLFSLIEKSPFDDKMNDYISSINYGTKEGYRIVASFSDGTYASVRILNDEKFDSMIASSCVLSVQKKFKINYLLADGSEFKESLISKNGCTADITVSNYENNEDACYYVDHYSKNVLTLGNDEDTNVASIYYAKYASTLTIHYKSNSESTIATDVALSGNCGATYYPEQYKKNISGYNYSRATSTEVTLAKNNLEVTLYYAEGSASDE